MAGLLAACGPVAWGSRSAAAPARTPAPATAIVTRPSPPKTSVLGAEAGAAPTPAPTAASPGIPGPPSFAPPAVPPSPTEIPARAQIPGVVHVWQKWNNCGPSSVLMAMSAHGMVLDQMAVAAELKPDREDTNVSPEELARFARNRGLGAWVRLHGNRDVVRRLVAAGVPVIAEQWIAVEGRGEMGHYRVVVGYDDESASFLVQDSYYGPRRSYAYDEFETMWRPFVGRYVAVFRPDQEMAVAGALGPDMDEVQLLDRALADHEAWAAADEDEAWAWFTLGEVRTMAGQHSEAVAAFERAIALGLPPRAFWYQFGFYRSLAAQGFFTRLLGHSTATLATMKGENLEESHYWRGVALEGLGRHDEAMASFATALQYNPLFSPAAEALASPPEE